MTNQENTAMGTDNLIFLENIEWFDDTGKELVHRIPEKGSGEIKYGAQLTVRDSQAGIFFYKGKAVEAFGPGRHTLETLNIPILTKIISIPWGMTSPLRAEVYFVNMKIFTNLKWGTRDPVAFKDSELGLIRLRAFGVFNLQVVQPVLFINRLVGTQGMYTTEEIEEYLNSVIVSRFNDFMGETIDSILTLPDKYDELSEGLAKRLQKDFSHFGLGLTHIYMNSITPPPEVQQAIDDRSRMGVFKDMNKLMQMKAAMAMEKASEAEVDDAGHVCPVLCIGKTCRQSKKRSVKIYLPGVSKFNPDRFKVLPILRTPATCFHPVHKLREKSDAQRHVLFTLRSPGRGKTKIQNLLKMRFREPG